MSDQVPGSSAPTDALNQSIVQTVDKTNSTMIDAGGPEGTAMAFQKVSQACAFSIQDSTDYMRNIMTMAATASGVCMQKMISEKTPDPWAAIMTECMKAATTAQQTFSDVGTAATAIMTEFPKK